ncbi:MAG: DUF512 domain-containing protein [Defluviitaleaceae bacterium]|nr:DUF512 domain-containing protein [Defluviitaleaceae bacterium]
MKRLITNVDKYSIGAELGIEVGDKLVAKNGTANFDIFDYYLAIGDTTMNVLIEKPDGNQFLFDIEKDNNEDLGLGFQSTIMDDERVCENKCIFCFADQKPKGMRDAEYHKGDDYRLSFMHGNHISMTNMTSRDVDRILQHRISPINISVHTTDEKLRAKMMGNRNAGKTLKYLKKLAKGGVAMGMQIVLCKDINDGEHLEKTIHDLSRLVPKGVNGGGFSLSIVPARLTSHREENGLPHIEPFTDEDCKQIVERVEAWQLRFLNELGTHFVYASDEFYLRAGVELPSIEVYEEFLRIKNGVGVLTLFSDEFAYTSRDGLRPPGMRVTVVTGLATAEFMRKLTLPFVNVNVMPIENNFYGKNITHSSYLTGQDIVEQLKGKTLGDVVLLPASCLRYGENVLSDGMSVYEISQELGVEVLAIIPTGGAFVNALKSL